MRSLWDLYNGQNICIFNTFQEFHLECLKGQPHHLKHIMHPDATCEFMNTGSVPSLPIPFFCHFCSFYPIAVFSLMHRDLCHARFFISDLSLISCTLLFLDQLYIALYILGSCCSSLFAAFNLKFGLHPH